jgi:predicted heme/steroid binding protein
MMPFLLLYQSGKKEQQQEKREENKREPKEYFYSPATTTTKHHTPRRRPTYTKNFQVNITFPDIMICMTLFIVALFTVVCKAALRDFTPDQLMKYNGVDNDSIYIARYGVVYDVSSLNFPAETFGKDIATLSVHISEAKIKQLTQENEVGRVSSPRMNRKFTVAELARYMESVPITPGRIDREILIGISGKIYDVSYGGTHMYTPGGSYGIFAGREATRALAKMSFEPEDLASRDLSDLNEEQLEALINWETLFRNKYPQVGTII